jgi:SAM-dependent methyltransferase
MTERVASSSTPSERFTNRVADYVKARPGYPAELAERLRGVGALPTLGSPIADIGSGTGISAAWLLDEGYRVVGVEPNAAMRSAAEERFADEPRFQSVAGSAEATTLTPGSVAAILVAQAFHWFEPEATRREFLRVVERGPVILLWNDRRTSGSALLEGYEALLQRWAIDYNQVNHRRIGGLALDAFFRGGRSIDLLLPNVQRLDLAGLRARLRSSSYVPAPTDPRHASMMAELDELFHRTQHGGEVEIIYDLRVRVGWFGARAEASPHGGTAGPDTRPTGPAPGGPPGGPAQTHDETLKARGPQGR